MSGLVINPGSGAVPQNGFGWANTEAQALAEAAEWLERMRREGFTDIRIEPQGQGADGRWCFEFVHEVTGARVKLQTHGITDIDAYMQEHIFLPRVYWNGSSSAEPQLEDFAAPGFEAVKTYRASEVGS